MSASLAVAAVVALLVAVARVAAVLVPVAVVPRSLS